MCCFSDNGRKTVKATEHNNYVNDNLRQVSEQRTGQILKMCLECQNEFSIADSSEKYLLHVCSHSPRI